MNVRPARLCTVNRKSPVAGDIDIKSDDKDRVGDAIGGGNKKWRAGSTEGQLDEAVEARARSDRAVWTLQDGVTDSYGTGSQGVQMTQW